MKTHARRSPTKRSSRRGSRSNATEAANDTQLTGRTIWRGSISFGLVQIPVGLVAAERTDELARLLAHGVQRHLLVQRKVNVEPRNSQVRLDDDAHPEAPCRSRVRSLQSRIA